MTHVAEALQAAFYTALTSSPDVMDTLEGGKVYDQVVRNTEEPFIAFSTTVIEDWSTGTETGFEMTQSLSIRTRTGRRAELFAVMDAVTKALTDPAPSPVGYRLVTIQPEFQQIRIARNRKAQEGAMRFRMLIEPNDP